MIDFEKVFAVSSEIQPYCVTLRPENLDQTYGIFLIRMATSFDVSDALSAELDWIDNEYNGIVTQSFARNQLALSRENWLSVAIVTSFRYYDGRYKNDHGKRSCIHMG